MVILPIRNSGRLMSPRKASCYRVALPRPEYITSAVLVYTVCFVWDHTTLAARPYTLLRQMGMGSLTRSQYVSPSVHEKEGYNM